jgi:predicted nucleic acid-binding protein
MGLIIDTSVFVRAERHKQSIAEMLSELVTGLSLDDDVYISVATVSELLVGVHCADSEERRMIRSAFVEQIIASFTAIEITAPVSRVHAIIVADLLRRGEIIGVQDMWIAATAIQNSFSVLTYDASDFSRIKGLNVIKAK